MRARDWSVSDDARTSRPPSAGVRAVAASELAPDTWHAANEQAASGEAALARRDDVAAAEHFDAARVSYEQATSDADAMRTERAWSAAEAAALDVAPRRAAAVSAEA